jgi:hypothetical protein
VTGAVFVDRTSAITGFETNWSDNNGNAFDATITAVDTTLVDTIATYLYMITFQNAYGFVQSDTTRENFSGGYDTVTRNFAARVFFIVEHFNADVVFPNGVRRGRAFVTPCIDGRRRPDLKSQATVIRMSRGT